MRREWKITGAVLLSIGAVAVLANPVAADQGNTTTACLKGIVEGSTTAELQQSVGTSYWDNKGGLKIASNIGNVGLRAYDYDGNSVCQETANNSTSCTFRIGVTNPDVFRIEVQNFNSSVASIYTLCSF